MAAAAAASPLLRTHQDSARDATASAPEDGFRGLKQSPAKRKAGGSNPPATPGPVDLAVSSSTLALLGNSRRAR